MSVRTTAAVLAALTLGGSSLVLAAGDAHPHDDWHRQHREVAREIRQAVREAVRSVRADTRPMVRDIVRQVTREVHAATVWTPADRSTQSDREARRRQAVERRRERAAQTRAQREAQRDAARSERDRERNARAFRTVSPTDDACADAGRRDRGHACEVRDSRLPAPIGPLTIDAARNGSIRVEAWDQADVLVQAVVQGYGNDDAEAKAMLPQVRVDVAGTQVSAEGPSSDGSRRGWSVSFRVWAPRQTALALKANNGGVSLHGMTGESRFTTTNGGVTLDAMGGHVVGSTRNGGVNVRLDGSRWNGDGLEVETSNGGVSLAVPEGYSAELETSTVNGGVRSDYPVTVQGRIDRQLRTTLGSGGPRLKITTVNGGVRITRR